MILLNQAQDWSDVGSAQENYRWRKRVFQGEYKKIVISLNKSQYCTRLEDELGWYLTKFYWVNR